MFSVLLVIMCLLLKKQNGTNTRVHENKHFSQLTKVQNTCNRYFNNKNQPTHP